MAKVTMPQLGESVAEGTIGKWLKQPGDHVAKYEPLLEVITDKVNAEVPSPFEGVLKEILAEEGATVPNNAEIAVIETADDGASDGSRPRRPTAARHRDPRRRPPAAEGRGRRRAPHPSPAPAGSDAVTGAAAHGRARTGRRPPPPPRQPLPCDRRTATAAPTAHGDPDARMTPAVRRLLREHGLSAEQIVGTGGGGRITRDDVLAVVETIRTGGQPPATGQRRRQPQPATQPQPAAGHQSPRPPPPPPRHRLHARRADRRDRRRSQRAPTRSSSR